MDNLMNSPYWDQILAGLKLIGAGLVGYFLALLKAWLTKLFTKR